jgi:hypothetical protein
MLVQTTKEDPLLLGMQGTNKAGFVEYLNSTVNLIKTTT